MSRTTAAISCSRCDALCCQLPVVLQAGDTVPPHLTSQLPGGLRVMARDPDGWCVALDGQRMECRIYDSRPATCRAFAMGGSACRAVRAEQQQRYERAIALELT